MARKFWYTIIKSTDKKKVNKKWNKIVRDCMKKTLKKYIVNLLSTQEKINDKEFKVSNDEDRTSPKQKAHQYPLFYVKRGKDEKYYIRTKGGYWDKITTRTVEEPLLHGGIPYTLGYESKDKYAQYKYMDLPKKVKEYKDALKFLKKNQKVWDKGMAVEFEGLTIIGGYTSI